MSEQVSRCTRRGFEACPAGSSGATSPLRCADGWVVSGGPPDDLVVTSPPGMQSRLVGDDRHLNVSVGIDVNSDLRVALGYPNVMHRRANTFALENTSKRRPVVIGHPTSAPHECSEPVEMALGMSGHRPARERDLFISGGGGSDGGRHGRGNEGQPEDRDEFAHGNHFGAGSNTPAVHRARRKSQRHLEQLRASFEPP